MEFVDFTSAGLATWTGIAATIIALIALLPGAFQRQFEMLLTGRVPPKQISNEDEVFRFLFSGMIAFGIRSGGTVAYLVASSYQFGDSTSTLEAVGVFLLAWYFFLNFVETYSLAKDGLSLDFNSKKSSASTTERLHPLPSTR